MIRKYIFFPSYELFNFISYIIICFYCNRKRLGGVTVLQAKVALAVLSSSRLQEKHQFLFRQVADHNNCVSRKKLEILLQGLATLVEYLSEGKAFGPALVPATVDSCFQLVSMCEMSLFHRRHAHVMPYKALISFRNICYQSRG